MVKNNQKKTKLSKIVIFDQNGKKEQNGKNKLKCLKWSKITKMSKIRSKMAKINQNGIKNGQNW